MDHRHGRRRGAQAGGGDWRLTACCDLAHNWDAAVSTQPYPCAGHPIVLRPNMPLVLPWGTAYWRLEQGRASISIAGQRGFFARTPGTSSCRAFGNMPIFSYSDWLAARWIRACHVFQEHFRRRSRRGPEVARVHCARIAGAGKSEDFALPSRKEPRHEKYRNTTHRSTLHHPARVRVFVQPEQLPHCGRGDGEDRDRAGRGRDRQRGPGDAEADQRLRHDRGRELRERGHRLQRCFRVATEGAGRGERRHRTADLFLVDGGAQLHPAAARHHGPGGRPAVAGAA